MASRSSSASSRRPCARPSRGSTARKIWTITSTRVRAGHPKQGLIWHFQGSGKSLLMVFAALKLRMMEDLQNPTVVIIDDRLDLETQITATFQTTDIPNLASLSTKEDVERFFEQDTRKIAITTIFRFGDVDHVLNERSNIILMVDEAHRTQEGDLGARMRLALPNAFFFGLTGTPINKLDHNTFKTFGSTEDPSGYMSKYSFADSIRDHATLPLRFEPVPVELHIDKEKLETEFDALTEGLTDDQRAELSRRVNMKAIMYNRERIRKVCEHIVRHFQTKVAPNGYKGQIVVYDRECCLMYKEELDRLLPPEASTIVMDTNNDKAGRYKKYARSRADEEKLLDTFREKTSPLKLVIVTSKLLTGFDAPILQCMYLDKPMKDHTLLQAICRVNRVYDEGKALGLVVDYIGIFDDAAKALSFDDASMKKVIENIEGIKQQLPILLAKCLSYFNGVDRTKEGWEGLIEAQEKLPDNETKDKFAADYGVLNKAWNILSPDPVLAPYRDDYLWLSRVYESVKPMDQSGALIWASLGPKTMQLIDENIEVGDADETIEAITMDPEMIERFIAQPNSEKAAKKIEIQLIAILRKKHSKKYQEIGEKLERLREQHEQRLINSVEFLRQLLELAREAARAEQEVVPKEEQDKGKAALTELFNGIRTEHTPVMVERIVNDIDGIVKLVRFDGWQNTATGQKEVQRALRKIVWQKYSIKDQDVFEKAYRYIEEYY
ncbi:MAG: HsdR family type I site-specific deoxyribonuclease [Selenomonas sp.]|uniref:type I restriction endonuclease subunit R n=1 Tax=Selenomonas sp. TaxID=2053611 RepID=UPI0025FEBEF8|nr:HsdR family type I site-specific deoxyribonuclease [Selenomonas sp.]MCI6087018.1 HsdR family type I site-specific deoxyribonuclease [Selenomonas sp.]